MVMVAEFRFGDVFEPNSQLAKWALKLAMSRNDLLHVHSRLLEDAEKETIHEGMSFYFFRIAVSHFREILKMVDYLKDDPEVIGLIEKISKEAQDHYKTLLNLSAPFRDNSSFFFRILVRVRDYTNHYYDLSDKKNYDKELHDQLVKLQDLTTNFKAYGTKLNETVFAFADHASFHILFGVDIDDNEYRATIRELSGYMSSFISFAEEAILCYLSLHEKELNISNLNEVIKGG